MGPLSAILAAASMAAAPVSAEVEAPGPSGPLRGTLLTPADAWDAPVVLIISGSGATDRDGNNPMGVRAAPYRLLAEALAARGIATARVDKRGLFGSAGAGNGNPNAVRVSDYAADIRAWVGALRARTSAPCIWVMGHSEGVLMALASAAENGEGICGLLLVSGAGRRISDVLREQLPASPDFRPHLDRALPALAELEAGRRVDTTGMDRTLLQLFAPPVQDYLIDLIAHDPAALAARVRVPMLIVQGLRDIQITEQDARRLAAANPNARLVLLPEVNHVLKAFASDDRAANAATYANPDLPLAPEVAEAIVEFVRR